MKKNKKNDEPCKGGLSGMKNNQAPDKNYKWSRLLKKRELLAFYLVCYKSKRNTWNIGELIDYLMHRLYFSRKVAFSIVRRLKRLGVLVSVGENELGCIDFLEYLDSILENYASRRARKFSKNL